MNSLFSFLCSDVVRDSFSCPLTALNLLDLFGACRLMLLRNLLEDTCFLSRVGRASAVIKHFVHLLECLPVRLGDAEPSPDTAEQTEDSEEHIRAKSRSLDERWRDEADDEVPEPVVAGGDGDTFRSQGGGEDFGWHRPWNRSPAGAECDHIGQ